MASTRKKAPISPASRSPAVTLILPHQLFEQHPAIEAGRDVYLLEETLYFNELRFHQKKLVLHRASMKYYQQRLESLGQVVHYIEAGDPLADIRRLIAMFRNEGITDAHYVELSDDWLERRLVKACGSDIRLHPCDGPGFLNTPGELNAFQGTQTSYFQTNFYKDQRKRSGLLLREGGQPEGGKWTFDQDNRLRYPKGLPVPEIRLPVNKDFLPEAISYVQEQFPENPGNLEPPFFKREGFYPITHAEAADWLEEFVEERLGNFGNYEDAMVAAEPVLFHGCLTPMLNTGLLTPVQVLDRVISQAGEAGIAINNTEGFVRQIIGWREFIRMVYLREGRKQRTSNYWGFTRKIPSSFWTGTTGIDPVDTVIRKVLQNAYSHHIERLMIMGNFMLLCEFDPHEVYRWFMEMYIDAYDWVMVPNTYGMTQFADGGLMTTKPYISGSNYLMKMGNWKKGDWQEIWDGLFWRFMHVHRGFFSGNPRLGILLGTLDKMDKQKLHGHLDTANRFLATLDAQPGY